MTGLLVLVAFLVVGVGSVFAQSHDVTINIDAVALLAVDEPGTEVVLSTVAPLLAGDPVTGSSDDKAIFYTVLAPAGSPYRIEAELDALPAIGLAGDIAISLNAVPGAGNGTNEGPVTLTTAGQPIITAIGSTVTGRNPATAPLLTYTLVVNDVSNLAVGDTDTVLVTLTITNL